MELSKNEQYRNSVIIIDGNTLKSKGFIDEEFDNKLIKLATKTQQDILIEPLLGTQVYLQLLAQCANNNLLDSYKYIVENYILFIVGYAVKAELYLDASYKLKNKGTVTTNGTNVNNASLNEIQYMQTDAMNKVASYSKRLSEFMFTHRQQFPEYDVTLYCNEFKSGNVDYNCPIYLKKVRKR